MKLMKDIFISKDLVEHFKRKFPDKLPLNRGITPEQIAFLQGQQSVIERMEFILNDDKPEEN